MRSSHTTASILTWQSSTERQHTSLTFAMSMAKPGGENADARRARVDVTAGSEERWSAMRPKRSGTTPPIPIVVDEKPNTSCGDGESS